MFGFTFPVPAHLGSPGQRAVKRVSVCVCVQRDGDGGQGNASGLRVVSSRSISHANGPVLFRSLAVLDPRVGWLE